MTLKEVRVALEPRILRRTPQQYRSVCKLMKHVKEAPRKNLIIKRKQLCAEGRLAEAYMQRKTNK